MRIPLLLLLLGALVLAACDDDDDITPTATETPTPTATATPSPKTATPTTPSTATSTPSATPPETPPPGTPRPGGGGTPPPGDTDASTAAAIDALAGWLGPVGDRNSITVRSVESETWPDGCLGLGRTGEACTDALVPGFRIELALANATYELRTDEFGEVVRWAPQTQLLVRFVEASANLTQFSTDDGGTIEAQPVSGTLYGVDLTTLPGGAQVSIGVADAPQSGGLLLVWVDPAE